MLRRCMSAAAVLLVIGGFVLAETIQGTVTSLTTNEIKIKAKKGEEKTIRVTDSTKITTKNKDGENKDLTIDQAVKMVSKQTDKGKAVRAKVEFDEGKDGKDGKDGKATSISFGGGKGKKTKE